MSRAVGLLPVLFLLRLLQVFLNFPAEFGGLFRPEPFSNAYAQPLILFAAAIILFNAVAVLKRVTRPVQKCFTGFLAFNYLLIALFHNKVGQRSFLCEIIDDNLQSDELFGLYAMDFLFQAPYYCWGLLWIAFCAGILNHKNRLYLLPACIVPALLPIRLSNDVFPAIAALTMATATTVGIFIGSRRSAAGIMYFWCGGLMLVFAWMNSNAAIYRNSWFSALILALIVWVPGIVFNEVARQKNAEDTRGLSWLIPAVCGMTWLVTLTNVPLGHNLFNLWFSIFSLQFAAWSAVAISITATTAFLANRILNISARKVYLMLATLISGFYLLDCLVMYKTGLRPDLDTALWVAGLDNITSLTSTITSLNPAREILLPVILFTGVFLTAKRFSCLRFASDNFKAQLTVALSAALFYQIFTGMPGGLFKDPLLNLLSSVQAGVLTRSRNTSSKELSDGFAGIGVNITASAGTSALRQSGKKNLILVMLESTSNQYVSLFGHSEKTWPRLEKYRDRMEIFPFFFSCFPDSSNADFSVMSGLYPPDYQLLRQNQAIPVKLLADHLHAAGYDCSLFFSGFLGDTGLSAFYRTRGFDRIYDAGNMPEAGRNESWLWGVREEHVTGQIKKLLGQLAAKPDKPFFIYYRMLFPHAPFQSISGDPPVFNEDGHQQGNLVGRFKNCLLYQDAQIAGLIEHLDSCGIASSTVVMLVADHGTMLGETGRLGHGWNLDPLLTNVPMVIIRPQAEGIKVNLSPGMQADILPTALGLTMNGAERLAPCQGRDLLNQQQPAPDTESRRIFLTSMTQTAIIENNNYYWFSEDRNRTPHAFSFNYENGRTVFRPLPAADQSDYSRLRALCDTFVDLQRQLLQNLHILKDFN